MRRIAENPKRPSRRGFELEITENWRGRPLVDHETIVNLIGSVRTSKGLVVKAKLDTRSYPTGVEVPDDEMEAIDIVRDPFHREWSYTILPRSRPSR